MDHEPGRIRRTLAALRRLDSGERLVAAMGSTRWRSFTDLVDFSDWVLEHGDDQAVSDAVRERLDPEQIATKRRWRFKPKGAPKGLQAYVAEHSG